MGLAKWQVPFSAGLFAREPRWRADSKGLFYLDHLARVRPRLMSVAIGAGPNPVGTPKALFDFNSESSVTQINGFLYAPSPDGQHFLVDGLRPIGSRRSM
jgi:hypothetical protein